MESEEAKSYSQYNQQDEQYDSYKNKRNDHLGVKTAEKLDQSDQYAKRSEVLLGNPELPISDFRERINEAVNYSQATVITAETGAGKSTQVPQFLAEEGYKVIVTQPRVLAARSLAERVGEEVVGKAGADFDTFVGYRTARERHDHPDNQILFVTDGLQMVRELSGRAGNEKQVLVLDEIHEWNVNMEVLLAWARKQMSENPNFKVVCMSATMEAGRLATYLSDQDGEPAPVIDVPGRTFPVEKRLGGNVVDDAMEMIQSGKNTLVFAPGKEEINQIIQKLEAQVVEQGLTNVEVLPLHGQLEPQEQRRVFRKYQGKVKVVVSTNVAQTSITIDDIDAVVDTGLERRFEFRNGVESLLLKNISQADCLQRAGRAGRVKAGEYITSSLEGSRPVALESRELYPTPEIQRSRLDGVILHIAKAGLDISNLDFYHQPNSEEIASAKKRLLDLGAIDNEGKLTKIGHKMERLPVESHYARMLIESERFSPEVQNQVAGIIAVLEADGICMHSTQAKSRAEKWRDLIDSNYQDSELIKYYEVFLQAERMSSKELKEHDISFKGLQRARDTLRQLRKAAKLGRDSMSKPNERQREQIIECIVSGMIENIYPNRSYHDPIIGRRSLVSPSSDKLFTCGFIKIQGRRGSTLIANNITKFKPSVLLKVAPQITSLNETPVCVYLNSDGYLMAEHEIKVRDLRMEVYHEKLASRSEVKDRFIKDSFVSLVREANEELFDEVKYYSRRDKKLIIGQDIDDWIADRVEDLVPYEATHIDQLKEVVPELCIDDIVSKEYRDSFEENFPDDNGVFPLRYAYQTPRYDGKGIDLQKGTIWVYDPETPVDEDGDPIYREIDIAQLDYQDMFLPGGAPILYDGQELHDIYLKRLQMQEAQAEPFVTENKIDIAESDEMPLEVY